MINVVNDITMIIKILSYFLLPNAAVTGYFNVLSN